MSIKRTTGAACLGLLAGFGLASTATFLPVPAQAAPLGAGGMVPSATVPNDVIPAQARRSGGTCAIRNIITLRFEEGETELSGAEAAKLRDAVRRGGQSCTWRVQAFSGDAERGKRLGQRNRFLSRNRTRHVSGLLAAQGVRGERAVILEGSNTRNPDRVATVVMIPLSPDAASCERRDVREAGTTGVLDFQKGQTEFTRSHVSDLKRVADFMKRTGCVVYIDAVAGANTTARRSERFNEARDEARARMRATREFFVREGVNPRHIVFRGLTVNIPPRQRWQNQEKIELSIGS